MRVVELDMKNRTVKDGWGRSYGFVMDSTMRKADARDCRACGGGDAYHVVKLKIRSRGDPTYVARLCFNCLADYQNGKVETEGQI